MWPSLDDRRSTVYHFWTSRRLIARFALSLLHPHVDDDVDLIALSLDVLVYLVGCLASLVRPYLRRANHHVRSWSILYRSVRIRVPDYSLYAVVKVSCVIRLSGVLALFFLRH